MLGCDSDSQGRLLHAPLFIHFPNLLLWNVVLGSDEHPPITSSGINSLRTGLQTHCPRIQVLDIDELWFAGSHFRALLSTVTPAIDTIRTPSISRLRSYQLPTHNLSTISIHSITTVPPLIHDLTSLIDSYNEDIFPDYLFTWIVESCPCLRVLSIFRHITTVRPFSEEAKWACQGLEVLRVMVREIKSPDRVDACLARLKDLRRDKGIETQDGGESVGVSVVKKLAQLPMLKTVWLGAGDVHLDPFE